MSLKYEPASEPLNPARETPQPQSLNPEAHTVVRRDGFPPLRALAGPVQTLNPKLQTPH